MKTTGLHSQTTLLKRLSDSERFYPWLLILLVVLDGTLSFILRGVLLGGDTLRYTDGADRLLTGAPFIEKQHLYTGYILIVALSKFFHLNLIGVVLFQWIAAGFSVCCLYVLGKQLAGPHAGFLAGLLAMNPFITLWHNYIYSDSLYTSMVIFSVWSIHRAQRSAKGYLLAPLLVFFTAMVRLNGWTLPPIMGIHWIFERTTKWRFRLAGFMVVSLLTISAVYSLMSTSKTATVVKSDGPGAALKRGDVIWGDAIGRIAMPQDFRGEEHTFRGLLSYFFRHPVSCLKIAGARVWAELIQIRPQYSLMHNGLVLTILLPLYAFGIVGWTKVFRHPLARLMTAVIVAQLGIVALTFADWDGRFIIHVIPLIGVFAACGMSNLLSRGSNHAI